MARATGSRLRGRGRDKVVDDYGFGSWWAVIFGGVLFVLGLALAAGGAWLIWLGGSWYYLLAGTGLMLSGVLTARRLISALWVYGCVWLLTLVWAYWEVGLDGWALVPRVVAPTILMLMMLATIPVLRPLPRHGLIAILIVATTAMGGGRDPAHAQDTTAPDTIELPVETETTGPGATTATTVPAEPAAADEAGSKPQFDVGADWPAYGGTYHATRYSPLDQINVANVDKLTEVWTYRTGDMPSAEAEGAYSPENTPLKVGDRMYLCTAMNILIAVDPATGREIWRHDPGVSPDAIPYGATCRGVAYYEAPELTADADCAARIIVGTLDARLIAVDAETGAPCVDFGRNGAVDLNQGIGLTVPGWYALTSPPTIVRGIAVVGAQVKDGQAEDSPSGVVRGYDAVTGEFAWAWDLGAPGRTGQPPEAEVYTRGTPNMWTIASGDEELGHVYLPMGNSAVDYWGGNRSEAENEFSTALVAIDVTTGEVAWKFQTVHYDLWDYDLGSQATLVDLPTEQGPVPALILPSKQGQIYVLNRETGKPLYPVEERPVPSGGVEPEALSPTQPYSSYASLDKPNLTERDMWGMSPLDQLWCRIQFRRAAYDGQYTPPTADRPFIQYPGYNGGSDWGSVAVDPVRGILVANYNDMPNFNRLLPREEANERGLKPIYEDGELAGEGGPQAGSPYAIQVNAGWRLPTGLLCKEPPYGWIRAIDLATGETLWDHPLGSAVNNGPFGIPSMLPLTIGTPNNGGPLVTAGGLIFVAATTDGKFRAFDIGTGRELWQTDLPAGGQTTAITYEVDGRQYVAIAPGGHHFMETPIGDHVIAYALPNN